MGGGGVRTFLEEAGGWWAEEEKDFQRVHLKGLRHEMD
jgi:hypothetical protein